MKINDTEGLISFARTNTLSPLPLLLPLLLLLPLSCRRPQDMPQPVRDNAMEWEVGQSAESVTQVVGVGRSGKLTVELTTTSLCSNSAVRLEVETEGKVLFSETVKSFPFVKTVAVPKKAKIGIETSIVAINQNKCKWLGTALCRAYW